MTIVVLFAGLAADKKQKMPLILRYVSDVTPAHFKLHLNFKVPHSKVDA